MTTCSRKIYREILLCERRKDERLSLYVRQRDCLARCTLFCVLQILARLQWRLFFVQWKIWLIQVVCCMWKSNKWSGLLNYVVFNSSRGIVPDLINEAQFSYYIWRILMMYDLFWALQGFIFVHIQFLVLSGKVCLVK